MLKALPGKCGWSLEMYKKWPETEISCHYLFILNSMKIWKIFDMINRKQYNVLNRCLFIGTKWLTEVLRKMALERVNETWIFWTRNVNYLNKKTQNMLQMA